MANWPDMTTAVADLRRFVNDSPQDRPIKRKQVVGRIDGVNVDFMTWDDRLIDGTLVITVDDAKLPPAQVLIDDLILGTFHLDTAPAQQTTVRASYFFQFFLDVDLVESMQMASQEISEGDDPTLIQSGLKLAALNFGAYVAYSKQAMRWAQRKSAQFLLEEEPLSDDNMNRSNLFQKLADSYKKNAIDLRQGFYQRHGRRDAPAFTVYKPRIPNIAPRR